MLMRCLAATVAAAVLFAADGRGDDKPKSDKVRIGPASYQVPGTWKRQQPRSQMRIVQFGIPTAQGDEGKAEFLVFYFQGQGGSVEDNIKRWKGMFEKIDGEPKVEKFEAGGFKVTTLDVTGDYKDKPFPMADDFTLRKGYRMLAAVVDTPDDGPYYFRVVGPKKTVAENLEGWNTMLKSAAKDG